LEPEVRIGSLEGAGADVFGTIKALAPLPDGRIAVLDAQAQEVRIFGADGTYDRTFAGIGDGPGELRDANGMLAGSDGLLRVHDPRSRRLSFFDPDVGYIRSEPIEVFSFGYIWEGSADSVGTIYEPTMLELGGGRWSIIKVYDANGIWVDTVRVEQAQVLPATTQAPGSYVVELTNGRRFMSVPFWPRSVRVLDPRGFFWIKGAGNEYRFVQTTFAGSGRLEVISERQPTPVAPSERDSAIASIRERAGGQELDWSQIPAAKPIVESMFLDDQGRIWVRVGALGATTTYDIFGRDGHFQGAVVTDLQVATSPMPVVVGDHFYAVVTDDLNVQYVVGARLRTLPEDDDGL
jgi:hypothetical protein